MSSLKRKIIQVFKSPKKFSSNGIIQTWRLRVTVSRAETIAEIPTKPPRASSLSAADVLRGSRPSGNETKISVLSTQKQNVNLNIWTISRINFQRHVQECRKDQRSPRASQKLFHWGPTIF